MASHAYPDLYNATQPAYAMQPMEWASAQPAAASKGGGMMAFMIWGPALLIAFIALEINQPVVMIMVTVCAMLVHTLFQPKVALYVLIGSIPLEWMVAVIPQVTQLSKLLGIFAMLVAGGRVLTASMPTRWDKSGCFIVLLVLWALCGSLWVAYPRETAVYASSFGLRWGMAVLICIQLTDRRSLRVGMLVFAYACVGASIVHMSRTDLRSAADTAVRLESASFIGQGSGANVNELARMFAVGVFIFLIEILRNRSFIRRILCIGCIGLLAIELLVLKGRAVWLGLPAALVLGMVMLGGAGIGKRLLFLVVAGGLGTAIGALIMRLGLLGRGIVDRFQSTFNQGTKAGNRIYFWMKHLEAFVDTGFVGVGYGQMILRDDAFHRVAHNDWIALAGELGLIGLLLFGAFHVSLYLRIRNLRDVWAKLFCLLTWILMLFVGLTENDFPLKWYAVASGFIIATLRIEEQERAATAMSRAHTGRQAATRWQ